MSLYELMLEEVRIRCLTTFCIVRKVSRFGKSSAHRVLAKHARRGAALRCRDVVPSGCLSGQRMHDRDQSFKQAPALDWAGTDAMDRATLCLLERW
jgi:hypothetical protein